MLFYFQNSGRFAVQGLSSPFTLWNRNRVREFLNITFWDGSLVLKSILQPGIDGECVSLIVLFGQIQSWYSIPCVWAYHGRALHSPICKRRVETVYSPPYFSPKITRCLRGQMFAIRHCFGIKSSSETQPSAKFISTGSGSVDLYFVHFFSVLSWHTSNMYHITIEKSHKDISEYCVAATSYYRPPYAHNMNILHHESVCDQSNITIHFHLEAQPLLPKQCKGGMFRCKDGSCVLNDNLCVWHVTCSPSSCACHNDGQEIRDIHYCLNICTPGICICPDHYFHCTSGGCIKMALVCDSENNCKDASDEFCGLENIDKANKKLGDAVTEILVDDRGLCLGFLCLSGECISLRYVNDLLADCSSGQGEDEPLLTQLRAGKIFTECSEPNTIPCIPGLPICFPLDKLCLYDFDVYGNTIWCRDASHLGDCIAMNCSNSYKCPESFCIPVYRVCNGHPDCIHGEDEKRCDEYICEGLLRCSSTNFCVHPIHICDGISHCPNSDDEQLCNMAVCPQGCDCLSYSAICVLKSPGLFPAIHSQTVKHILVIKSHIVFPDFHRICNQKALVILNISRNHIKAICGAFQRECKFYKKLAILDLSHNDIRSLRTLCFQFLISLKILSLAFNPLQTLDSYSLSHASVSYISIRGSQINTLITNIITHVNHLEIFDITETDLRIIDSDAEALLSDTTHIVFNDHRLCCIWKGNTHCRSLVLVNLHKFAQICPALLTHRSIGYLVFLSGNVVIMINIVAFFANRHITKRGDLSKLISIMACVDVILATYLPFIGAAEIYYNRAPSQYKDRLIYVW